MSRSYYASLDDDPRSEISPPPMPTRPRTRAPSDSGDRHIGHYWGSDTSLLEGPFAPRAPSGRSRPTSFYGDVVRDVPNSLPSITRLDSLRRDHRDYDGGSRLRDSHDYNVGSRRRDYHDYNVGSRQRDYHDYVVGPRRRDYDRDSPRLDYDHDIHDYNYEDEEWDERDRRRRRRTPAPSERSPSPMDHKIMEKLKRLEELEMKEREKMRQEHLRLNKSREKEEKEAREPAELSGGKEPAKQEGETSLKKGDELDKDERDGDKQPEKQEEAAKLRRHVEGEEDIESSDQEEITIKLKALELEASREMQKREEEIKQRMLLVKAKEEAEKLFEERVKAGFRDAGFSEEDAERKLKVQREKRAKVQGKSSDGLGLNKKTYFKVHRKHIMPETLDAHHLPWEPDESNPDFMIIKCWISKDDQEALFAHTRRIKERKPLASDGDIKQDDKLYIIRKKSPDLGRRPRAF